MSAKSSVTNMVLSLGVITIVAGALLALVYNVTADPIAKAELDKQTEAIAAVAPAFDNSPLDEAVEVTVNGESEPVKVYPAMKDGQLVGVAVESYTDRGFSGRFTVMYGFDAEGNVNGYSVLSHSETPGLGAKMGEWFCDPTANRSVVGKNPGTTKMTVAKDGGDIDAITAATISSRAFLDALNRAYSAYMQYRDTNSNTQAQ